MSQPSPVRPARSRITGATLAAAAFLIISLLAAGAILSGFDPLGQSGAPTPALVPTTPPTAHPSAIGPTATALPAPNQGRALITLIPPQPDPSGLAQSLPDAIRAALQGSPLAERVEVRTGQPILDDALEVAWLPGDGGLVRLVYHSRFQPYPVSLGTALMPYQVVGPEQTPLTIGPSDGPALAGGLAAALLELELRPGPGTPDRIRRLQSMPAGVGGVDQATNQAILLFALAQTQVAGGDLTAALDSYSQVLRLQPVFPAAALNRAGVYLALGDSASALATYDTFKDGAAFQDVMCYNRAIATLSGSDQTAALAGVDQLVKADPASAWRINLRGYLRWKSGDQQGALDDFKRASDLAPGTPILLINQAEALAALHRYDEALSVDSALVGLDPKNPAYRYRQALGYQAAGDAPGALAALSQALLLDPSYADAYVARARLEVKSGDCNKAQADAGQALTLAPDSGPAYQVTGDCLLVGEQWVKAEKAYTTAVQLGESNADLFAGRGYAHHRQDELQSAAADYRQAISLGRTDTTLLFRLGFALVDLNQRQDALNALLGAVNGGMDTAEAHAVLAIALDMNNRTDDAEIEYRHALSLEARFKDRAYLSSLPLWSPDSITRALAIAHRLK